MNIATAGVLSGNTSQVYAVKNPLTFIYNTTDLRDWYTNSSTYQDNTLWGDEDIKSPYDPCPKGWKIPADASSTFGDFATSTMTVSGSGTNVANGSKYIHMGWFPASGGRRLNSGIFYYVGSRGYCWSASQNDAYTKYLYYDMSGVVNPGTVSGRALGFPVRCIQE